MPVAAKAIVQDPAEGDPVHDWALSASVIVTVPDGAPAPGATTATLYEMMTSSPTTDGSGRSLASVVVVLALVTV